MLTTVSELAANIDGTSAVLIDEPEVSLHPDWQREYVPALLAILEAYPSTHTVIATHSHFLVANLPPARGSLTIAHSEAELSYETYDDAVFGRSPDNILYRVFGIGTSGNKYVEYDLRTALRMISGREAYDREKLKKIHERLALLSSDDNPALGEILASIRTHLESE